MKTIMKIHKFEITQIRTKNGNANPNHLRIDIDGYMYMQSFGVTIAMITPKLDVFIDTNAMMYERTTFRYLGLFLDESLDVVNIKINLKNYKHKNLNR